MNGDNILIVDDDVTFALMLKTWLGKHGFDSDTVSSVAAAKKRFKERDYSIVLTDMRLPDSDGIDLLQWMSVQKPGIPVIVMTNFAEIQNAVNSMKLGAFDYLSKPVNPSELLDKISEALKHTGKADSVDGTQEPAVEQVDFIENTVMRGSAERVDAEIVDSSLPTYKTGNDNELYDIQPDTDVAETRWKIGKGGRGILWNASMGLPHEDHIEMAGEKVSCVLRWGVTADHAFRCEKSLVFPMLRTIPNNTHASMNFRIAADIPSILAVNGRSLIREKVDSVRINGMVEVTSLWSKANDFIGIGPGAVESACIRMTRTIFPSTTLPAVYERFTLKNITGDNLLVTVPQLL